MCFFLQILDIKIILLLYHYLAPFFSVFFFTMYPVFFYTITNIISDEGDVYVWDLQSRQCVHRFTDSGCVNGTSVDIAPNSQVFACG